MTLGKNNDIMQGLLEFISTGGCSGRSSYPGPALTILLMWQKQTLVSLTLQQVQILGPFLHGISYQPTDLSLLEEI